MSVTGVTETGNRSSLEWRRLVALALVLTVFPLPPVPADGFTPLRSRIDPVLARALEGAAPASPVEVIIQFRGSVRPPDRAALEAEGFDIIHEFGAIPAVFARGPAAGVSALSRYDRTYWIELNERLRYSLDQSTTTVNATLTWASRVLDDAGAPLAPIDGSNVTVVVVDSGIDAGHPDLDYKVKTIMNLKSDTGYGPWYEMENSDTSSGHGTHVAGTVAGNGWASAGARRGAAPGATLIGLSTGEAVAIINALGAFEWVYEHSRPNANPHNIRVVSNSWGTSGAEYNPEDSITQMTEKITFENNVVVVFAAGNSGADDHEGQTITTNPYANTPASVNVAAAARDGSGIASFSSRGKADMNQTWPNIAAPGVSIWSSAARRTLIGMLANNPTSNPDPYYLDISGTSMATPHVSGIVALLWQACPDLRVSDVHEEHPRNATGGNDTWYSNPKTRIHEAELILKLTADYLNSTESNGVPKNASKGLLNRSLDFAQGYGLVNVRKAVALALTLHQLRKWDQNASVFEAYRQYAKITYINSTKYRTNVLTASWEGIYSRFNEQSGKSLLVTNQTKLVAVPAEAEKAILDLSYAAVDLTEMKFGDIALTMDYDLDGNPDWTGSYAPYMKGTKHVEVDISSAPKGQVWGFGIVGEGFRIPRPISQGNSYLEVRIKYTLSLQLVLSPKNGTLTYNQSDYHAQYAVLVPGQPTPDYSGGNISVRESFFNLSRVKQVAPPTPPPQAAAPFPWWLIVVFGVALVAAAIYYGRKRR